MGLFDFLSQNKDSFDALQSIFTSLFSIVGVYVAIKGLNTWRKEIKGKDKYGVGKKLLKTLYLLKLLIDDRKIVSINMQSEDPIEPEKRKTLYKEKMEDQIKAIENTYSKLNEEIVDASVFVGVHFVSSIFFLKHTILQLLLASTDYQYALFMESVPQAKEQYIKSKNILCGIPSEETEKFEKRFNKDFDELEDRIKRNFDL